MQKFLEHVSRRGKEIDSNSLCEFAEVIFNRVTEKFSYEFSCANEEEVTENTINLCIQELDYY